jgi:two-component system, LuxR family, response regulator FixJ
MSLASSEPASRSETKQEPSRREKKVVAVVDDDAAVCDSTQILLEVHDFVVRIYQSGAAFLEAKPAILCLIVDYHMPVLNGLELVAELRKRGCSIPVIMMTATADTRIEKQAAQLGIRRVLRKPLGSSLIAAVQEELGEP